MRIIALAAAAALTACLATAANASPASVEVTVGPELQAKAAKTYGVRDIADLAGDLKRDVERQLAKTGAYDGARIELVLSDAKPNRPTFKQLGDKPGLSMQSFGVGGAEISGKLITADGRETPISYRCYETDIRWAQGQTTWADAERSIGSFAHSFARGKTYVSR